MHLLNDNPVLQREMRGRLRLRRLGSNKAQAWTVGILTVVILYFYSRGLIALCFGGERNAKELWSLIAFGTLTLIVLLAPALASTAITVEREQQTWETLALTQLSASQILIGKWIARQFIPFLLIVIALPFLFGCAFFGEMGMAVFLETFFFLVITMSFFSMIGLLCSFQARRTMTATASALTVTALLCIGTGVIQGAFGIFGFYGGNNPALWINPFWVLNALFQLNLPKTGNYYDDNREGDQAGIYFYLFTAVIATALCLWWMIRRYRNSVRG